MNAKMHAMKLVLCNADIHFFVQEIYQRESENSEQKSADLGFEVSVSD